jgi:hypothetical protein
MSRATELAAREKWDAQILSVLKRIHVGQSAEAIAGKLGAAATTIRGRLKALHHEQAVQRIQTGRARSGYPVIVWRIPPPVFATATPRAFAVRPYTPPKPTIIPVRDGGRLAPEISDGASVAMGRYFHNPFSPTQEFPR